MDKIQLLVKKFSKETRIRGEYPQPDREYLQKKKKSLQLTLYNSEILSFHLLIM